MSRIGKQPVNVPKDVEVAYKDGLLQVKGPKGSLEQVIDRSFKVDVGGTTITVQRPSDAKPHRAKHGLYRALISNMVHGVSQGFSRRLEVEGVGYNVKVAGPGKVSLNVGFCHPVEVEAPAGVELEIPGPSTIVVKGADKQAVGQLAANIRRIRPPEPYKGKGIRYGDEIVRRKAGKAVGGK